MISHIMRTIFNIQIYNIDLQIYVHVNLINIIFKAMFIGSNSVSRKI